MLNRFPHCIAARPAARAERRHLKVAVHIDRGVRECGDGMRDGAPWQMSTRQLRKLTGNLWRNFQTSPREVHTDIMIKRTAYHESGHAVCGRLLGFVCGGAAIRADGRGSANVASVHSLHWVRDFSSPSEGFSLTDFRSDVLSSVVDKLTVCWAGGEAERIVFGDADDRGDLRQIKQLQLKYYVEDRDIEAARARARELLLQPKIWATVERVVANLLKKKILNGAEIDKICRAITGSVR
ncbi:MAG: hypothetical protein WAK04_21645 [Xanthobacteraceae bacterium]